MTSCDLLYNVLRANFDGKAAEGYVGLKPTVEKADGKAEYINDRKVVSISDRGKEGVDIGFEDSDGKVSTSASQHYTVADRGGV